MTKIEWDTKYDVIKALKKLIYPKNHDGESMFKREMRVRKSASEVPSTPSLYSLALRQRLLIALQDKERAVRAAAAKALLNFNTLDETIIPVLSPLALQNEDEEIRRTAVRLVGKIRQPNERALRILIAAAQDEEEEIRDAATRALCKLTLKKLSPTIIKILLQNAFVDNNWCAVRTFQILGKLKKLSKNLIKPVLPFLKHKKEEVRRIAVEILGHLHDQSETVNKALLGALQDKKEGVRRAAVKALSNRHNPSVEVITGLLNALQDKDSGVKMSAIEALGKLANPNDTVIQALLAALQDNDDYLRTTAAKSLSTLKNSQSMAVMFEQLVDSEQSSHYFSFCFEENYFLYIDHEQGRLTMRISTQIRHIPLSPACLARLEQQIIATAQSNNYPRELYTLGNYESTLQKKAVLQDRRENRPTRFVSDTMWAAHLVCKKNSRDAFLVIEGMAPEEHITRCYGWIVLQSNSNASPAFFHPYSNTGYIVRVDNSLGNLKRDQADYQSKSWAIDAVAGQQLLKTLDVEATSSRLNNATRTPVSQEESRDSLTWIETILKKLGLAMGGQWADFVVVLSHTQMAAEEKVASINYQLKQPAYF